ncbi:MAG TPA: hypothetical protein VIW01_03185 [Dehalococcoidia bacterium]
MINFAIALTRAWTAAYTRGLPEAVRAQRQEEIDCDLWEHQRLADFERAPTSGTAVEMLLRLVLGVPADLAWRVEAGASARSEKGTQMNDSWIMRGLLALALAIAIVPTSYGVFSLAGGGEWGSTSERLVGGLFWIAVGLTMGAGLLLSRSRPSLGLGLLALGVILISVGVYWAAVVTVPIGLVLLSIAYVRAGRPGWPRGARPA